MNHWPLSTTVDLERQSAPSSRPRAPWLLPNPSVKIMRESGTELSSHASHCSLDAVSSLSQEASDRSKHPGTECPALSRNPNKLPRGTWRAISAHRQSHHTLNWCAV